MDTNLNNKLNSVPHEEWLIIAHAANMDGRAASLTVTDKIPFLQKHCIQPILISGVLGSNYTGLEHYQLLPIGPAGIRFDLRHLIRRRTRSRLAYQLIVGLLALPLAPLIAVERILVGLSSQASWSVSAFMKAASLIKKRGISVVYTSGGAYSAHLAGYWLKLRFKNRIIWLAEIHDPLVKRETTVQGREERLLSSLEKKLAKYSNLVWWFTESALESAISRNVGLKSKSLTLLPGALDFKPRAFGSELNRDELHFGHFGSLTKRRSLDVFLATLSAWLRNNPKYINIIKVHLHGEKVDQNTLRVMKDCKLDQIVLLHDRLTRTDARQRMCEMSLLLIPHGDDKECLEYIPSKFYDYLWANRPIVVFSSGNRQFERLINERGGWFLDSSKQSEIMSFLDEVTSKWAENKLNTGWVNNPISPEQALNKIFQRVEIIRKKL